ncbi:MAG TPA: hypothetical protein VF817_01065 [Patescibacteria group bacterium]
MKWTAIVLGLLAVLVWGVYALGNLDLSKRSVPAPQPKHEAKYAHRHAKHHAPAAQPVQREMRNEISAAEAEVAPPVPPAEPEVAPPAQPVNQVAAAQLQTVVVMPTTTTWSYVYGNSGWWGGGCNYPNHAERAAMSVRNSIAWTSMTGRPAGKWGRW